MARIYLSPPHLNGDEIDLVADALRSNWVAPLGPHVDAFEAELAARVGVPHALATSSGTAALHLAMRLLGVGPGDEVLCPTLTFVATPNAITYEGAAPVFLDCDPATWTLDPDLVREELEAGAARGRLPKAIVAVDLYGQTADYGRLAALAAEFEVPIVEDAAEALGATCGGRPAGSFGRFGVFSFNGNKIITTSGGGMLVSSDGAAIETARSLAAQARSPQAHYEHETVGYNYRMSNVLAAIGRAQLRHLEVVVERRRAVFGAYRSALGDLAGLEWMPEAPHGRATRWLTCVTIDPGRFGATREDVRTALEAEDVEARAVWKPMHLQPLYAGARRRGGAVAERLFETGLCLPSGFALDDESLERVVAIVRKCEGSGSPAAASPGARRERPSRRAGLPS